MSYTLFISSGDDVSLNPEYNFKESNKKVENVHRTRSGNRYVYKWGDYGELSFGVKFISETDKVKINSWWAGNDNLILLNNSGTVVMSCQLMNKTTPINKFIKPYDNLFSGTIQLGTY